MKKKIVISILIVLVCTLCIGGYLWFNNSNDTSKVVAASQIENEDITKIEVESEVAIETIAETVVAEPVEENARIYSPRLTDEELNDIAKLDGIEGDALYWISINTSINDYKEYTNEDGSPTDKFIKECGEDGEPDLYYKEAVEKAKTILISRNDTHKKVEEDSIDYEDAAATIVAGLMNPKNPSGTSSGPFDAGKDGIFASIEEYKKWREQQPLTLDGHRWTPEFQSGASLYSDHLLSLEEYNEEVRRSRESAQEDHSAEMAPHIEAGEGRDVHIH